MNKQRRSTGHNTPVILVGLAHSTFFHLPSLGWLALSLVACSGGASGTRQPGASGSSGSAGSAGAVAGANAAGGSGGSATSGGTSGHATGGAGTTGGASMSMGGSAQPAGAGGLAGSEPSAAGGSEAGESGASGSAGAPPTPMCDGTPTPTATPPKLSAGTWTDISPPGLNRPDGPVPPYGCMDIQVSPCNPWVLYLTTDSEGLWRSTDGGANWNEIGNLPTPVSPGVLAIDPADPRNIDYIGGVRGASLGFWVSHDGGDTFTEPDGFTSQANNSDNGWVNDVYDVKADPADFNHVLLTFHSGWAFKPDAGVLETKDGGNTWIRHLPNAWGAGHSIWFLADSETWLLGTQNAGYWRTEDAGANWTQVSQQNMQHGGTAAYRARNGVLYVGALSQILRSSDDAKTFDLVGPSTQDGYYAVVGDGKRLYTARGNTGASTGDPDGYYVSDESDGTTWTRFNDQTFRDGPYRMAYDPVNGIVYSANWNSGVWALKIATP